VVNGLLGLLYGSGVRLCYWIGQDCKLKGGMCVCVCVWVWECMSVLVGWLVCLCWSVSFGVCVVVCMCVSM